jgi:hypothetical protein
MAGSSDGTDSPPDRAGQEPVNEGYVWLVGEHCVILGREWTHGDHSGITVVRFYGEIDTDDGKVDEAYTEWSIVNSENIAKWLATGVLRKVASAPRLPSFARA